MARGTDRIFGADRYVLYLDAAVTTLRALDGSRERGIRTEAERFRESPESAFDKQPREYVYHVRDLDRNVRAFATWCQNERLNAELCLVQDVYEKSNERDFWADLDAYDRNGAGFAERFGELSREEFERWCQTQRDGPRILVGP